jgi:hypothetical protein
MMQKLSLMRRTIFLCFAIVRMALCLKAGEEDKMVGMDLVNSNIRKLPCLILNPINPTPITAIWGPRLPPTPPSRLSSQSQQKSRASDAKVNKKYHAYTTRPKPGFSYTWPKIEKDQVSGRLICPTDAQAYLEGIEKVKGVRPEIEVNVESRKR